ncbi:MAG: DUF4405 domain-containing protein [Chlorobiaceae bacterium]|nr:DUF4405 domain-containing protein [Chlorobiaceae bacterium]
MNKSFSWRIFTSFGLFLSFFMLLVSGVILYIFPGSRGPGFFWEMGGLTKPAWQNQHIIFGFVFSVFSLGHLFFINWHAFLSYLKTKTSQGIKRPAELVTIVVLSSFVGLGTYVGIQPFSGILALGKGISKSWESKAITPPVLQAEHMTLLELSLQPGLGNDPEELEKKLVQAGLQVNSQRQTLAEIAAINGLTAESVYAILAPEKREMRELDGDHFDNNIQQQIADESTALPPSQQLAFRDEEMEALPDTTNNFIEQNNTVEQNNNNTTWSDVQAPDDELHRRTTRSCSSCH